MKWFGRIIGSKRIISNDRPTPLSRQYRAPIALTQGKWAVKQYLQENLLRQPHKYFWDPSQWKAVKELSTVKVFISQRAVGSFLLLDFGLALLYLYSLHWMQEFEQWNWNYWYTLTSSVQNLYKRAAGRLVLQPVDRSQIHWCNGRFEQGTSILATELLSRNIGIFLWVEKDRTQWVFVF